MQSIYTGHPLMLEWWNLANWEMYTKFYSEDLKGRDCLGYLV